MKERLLIAIILLLISLSVYYFAGFEIICAVGGFVENPEVNIRRAILIAFFSVAAIYILFSIVLYGVVGSQLANSDSSILTLSLRSFPNIPMVGSIVNGVVFASILGSGFSVFTSNCWNFHALAANNLLPFSNILSGVKSPIYITRSSFSVEICIGL